MEHMYTEGSHKTKLLIVDGIWGTGKTTTFLNIHHILNECGIAHSLIFDEAENYPIPLAPATEFLPFKTALLASWKGFFEQISQTPGVVLLESGLFNSIVKHAIEYNLAWERVEYLFLELQDQMSVVKPRIIYLHNTSIERAWQETCRDRGEDWGEFVAKTHLPVANASATTPYATIPEYLQDIHDLSMRIFSTLSLQKLALEVSSRTWATHLSQIIRFLDLPEKSITLYQCAEYTGIYHETTRGSVCEVRDTGKILQIKNPFGRKGLFCDLHSTDDPPLYQDKGTFSIPGFCQIDIQFLRDNTNQVRHMRMDKKLTVERTQFTQHFKESLQDTLWERMR